MIIPIKKLPREHIDNTLGVNIRLPLAEGPQTAILVQLLPPVDPIPQQRAQVHENTAQMFPVMENPLIVKENQT
jgi:hypothetical protein